MIFNKYTIHFYHYDNFYLNTDKKNLPSLPYKFFSMTARTTFSLKEGNYVADEAVG